jgi:hypothetical protein
MPRTNANDDAAIAPDHGRTAVVQALIGLAHRQIEAGLARAGNIDTPLPPTSDVEHVTLSGGLFGGFDVMRNEYIDKSRPRRGWLYRLLHRS